MDAWHIGNATLSNEVSPVAGSLGQPGDFDGLTLMRYAPFYRERSNGGVEQCLRRLNHGLLERHSLTVLQVYRVSDVKDTRIESEMVGKGRILWVPVPYRRTASRFGDLPKRAWFVYDQTQKWYRQNGDGLPCSIQKGLNGVVRRRMEDLRHRSVILGDPLGTLLADYKVNLLALHGLTYDAGSLIRHANSANIPFVLVSHFDNGIFAEPHVRTWLPRAAGIGSVSGSGLPDHMRSRCVNLSDGIDTEFFSLEQATFQTSPAVPMILLPALIKPGKGQERSFKGG